MKVCIITIVDYKNYGNRLQNCALNKALESLGIEVVNGLDFFSKSEWMMAKEKHGGSTFFIKKIPIRVIKVWHCLREKMARNNRKYAGRMKKLREFTELNMITFPYLYVKDNEDLKRKLDDQTIDYYIVGSDQVWNPYYEGHNFEFLDFTDSKKKLSFSASFGVTDLPDDCKERYVRSLETFRNLSVREKTGKKIIEDLMNRDCHVSVDPTLLLPRCEWENMIKEQNWERYTGDYIVTYFLGEVPQKILKSASLNRMKMYCLNDENDVALFGEGVETFLYLIKNAKYVLTDSFHATVFAIVFNTDFYVFNRTQKGESNMFTRLDSLLELFDLTDRVYGDVNIEQMCSITEEKWEKVNRVLDDKRTEEMGYLSKILFEKI